MKLEVTGQQLENILTALQCFQHDYCVGDEGVEVQETINAIKAQTEAETFGVRVTH